MKIIKLSNSILFLSINPNTDTVKCRFIYFIGWFTIKTWGQELSLKSLNLKQIKELFKGIADDWDKQYLI